MAIYSDNLPKGAPPLTGRKANWASLHLHNSITYLALSGTPYHSGIWSEWVQTAEPKLLDQLIKTMDARLLPDEKLRWIDPKNQRLLLGIERILSDSAARAPHETDKMPYKKYFELDYESRYENIILNIDIWNADLNQKEGIIARTRETLAAQQLDHTKTQWLCRDDRVQLDWALDYLDKTPHPQLKTQPPSTPDEKYAFILGTLDQPGQHPLERKDFLNSMRRAWSQYKYRHTGKSQRQVYFSLGKEARSKLEKAAEHHNRRKSDIVEELILKSL